MVERKEEASASTAGNRCEESGTGRPQRIGFAEALLPDGWSRNVVVELAADGTVESVAAGAERTGDVAWFEAAAVPGMANVHSHAHQRLMAGLTERSGPGERGRDSFWTWRQAMYSFAERLGPDQLEAVAEQAYVEMLEGGYTAVGEFQYLHRRPDGEEYGDPAELSLRCVSAARSAGIAMTILPVIYVRGGFDDAPLREAQRRFRCGPELLGRILDRLEDECGSDPALRWGIAPHSLRAVGTGDLFGSIDQAWRRDPSVPVHLHVAEQPLEVEECLEATGRRPVEWLFETARRHGELVDRRWCLVHATHLSPAEIEGLAASSAVVGLCPTTEANLGDGTFAAREHLERGGAIAVGTDSQVEISVAAELRQLELSQRLVHGERNVLAGGAERSTARTLYGEALAGGARALCWPMGRIEAGARADFLALDLRHPRLVGRTGDALLDSWVFAGDRTCLAHVWAGGVQVVRDGRHIRREDVLERYRGVVEALGAESATVGGCHGT